MYGTIIKILSYYGKSYPISCRPFKAPILVLTKDKAPDSCKRVYFRPAWSDAKKSISKLLHTHCVPRKGYKTITVKMECFCEFVKAVKEAKERHSIDNSEFLMQLLNLYYKHDR